MDQNEGVNRKLDTDARVFFYWGWGPSRDGKNMLGQLWMQVRGELR